MHQNFEQSYAKHLFMNITNSIAKFCFFIVAVLLITEHAQSQDINKIKADMGFNEAILLKTDRTADWTKGATIKMGSAPRGDATPFWWAPANPDLKSAKSWKVIAPWFVIYPGTNHTATNVRVKVYEITAYVLLKSTNAWKKLNLENGQPVWAANYKFNLGAQISKALPRVESDGQLSYKLTSNFNPIHGGTLKYDFIENGIDPKDIASVYAQARTQLILDNPDGIDDRDAAEILFSLGADYYPSITTKLSDLTPETSFPAVASSRFGLVKKGPRKHFMATIDPPGTIVMDISDYVSTGGLVALDISQFEANLPPGLDDKTAPTTPTSLAATLYLGTSADVARCVLTWNASTDNVEVKEYHIYRNDIKIATSASTSYIDQLSGSKGELLQYTVKAIDFDGNLSGSSNTATIVY